MDRIERMAQVCDVKSNKVKEELKHIKEFQPRMAELAKTLDYANHYHLNVSKYRDYPKNLKDFKYFGNGCYVYLFSNTKPSYDNKYFIDADGVVFTSDYSRNYQNNKIIFSDTFKLGASTKGEYNDERIYNLHELQIAFVRFEREVYEDIDNQLDKLEAIK